jgi:hypothetical protein
MVQAVSAAPSLHPNHNTVEWRQLCRASVLRLKKYIQIPKAPQPQAQVKIEGRIVVELNWRTKVRSPIFNSCGYKEENSFDFC